MLNIIYENYESQTIPEKETIRSIDSWFDFNFHTEWFEDPNCIQMIKDIDNTEVVGPFLMISPVFGPMAPTYLSGGVKTLIAMYKTNLIMDLTNCGENCADWVLKISDLVDTTAVLNYPMVFEGDNFNLSINGTVCHTKQEVLDKYHEITLYNMEHYY